VAKPPDADTQTAISLAIPIGMTNLLKTVRAQIDADPVTKGRVGLAYTEWMFSAGRESPAPGASILDILGRGNLGGAIVGAGWMNMLLSQADFVPISTMSSLMGGANLTVGSGIRKAHGLVWASPQYWMFWLYSHRAGDTVVATQTEVRHYDVHNGLTRMPEIPDVPYLDVLSTRNSTSGDLVLFVVNRDARNAIPATVRLQGFSAAALAQVDTLAANSQVTDNTVDRQDAIRPVASTMAVAGNEIRYEFPKLSLTVMTLKRR
jgi:alpha-N-arabinofuranosidase